MLVTFDNDLLAKLLRKSRISPQEGNLPSPLSFLLWILNIRLLSVHSWRSLLKNKRLQLVLTLYYSSLCSHLLLFCYIFLVCLIKCIFDNFNFFTDLVIFYHFLQLCIAVPCHIFKFWAFIGIMFQVRMLFLFITRMMDVCLNLVRYN